MPLHRPWKVILSLSEFLASWLAGQEPASSKWDLWHLPEPLLGVNGVWGSKAPRQKETLLRSKVLFVSVGGCSRVLAREACPPWIAAVRVGETCCLARSKGQVSWHNGAAVRVAQGMPRNGQIVVRLTPRHRGKAATGF